MSDRRDRGDRGDRGERGERGGNNRRKFVARRKVCIYCADKIRTPDYKDVKRLQRFISERGKITPRRRSGTCARHQRGLTVAVKRARHLALLPFIAAHTR
ncbi:MAG: 30S ribosomal protein S18 [Roseiflexaceae bacterium]|nr:30S ribosomal protein S18 [Roseiflexaceae bacterium]